jgi:formylglycine-generating enzyme required for sulfatase activity
MPKHKILKYFLIIILTSFISSIGIDAADHRSNLTQSIIGRAINGRAKLCPDDMVYVSNESKGLCIDKYESSASENCQYASPANQDETQINLNDQGCRPVSVKNAKPWTNISQTQAIIACLKAGKRLPVSEEWYLASLGTPDKNLDWTEEDCQVDGNWEDQPGLTGSAANCYSAVGASDMVGNVWEWVNGEIDNAAYKNNALPRQGYIKAMDISGLPTQTDPANPDNNYNDDYMWIKESGVRGIARGGYWSNQARAGQFSLYLASPSSYTNESVGFRCVK